MSRQTSPKMVYSVVISRETMRGRQDNLSVLAVTSVWLILSVCVTGIETTACTDQTNRDSFNHVTPMCKGGILYNTRVVIDTWGTGGPDVYSCTCTVTLGTKSPSDTARVTVQEYPGVEPTSYCASKLRITSTKSAGFIEKGCIPIPASMVDNFGTTDILTLTLSRAENSTSWQSGHCILISSNHTSNLDLNVNCSKHNDASSQFPKVSTSTSTKPLTSTSTRQPPTTPLPTAKVTTTTTTTPTTTTTSTRLITALPTDFQPVSTTGDVAVSSTVRGTGSDSKHSDVDIGIIAGAGGGGGLLLVIVIIVIIVIIRRRRPDNRHPVIHGNKSNGNTNEGLADDIQSYVISGTIKKYVNSDGDTITHNSLYESAGPRDPGDNHIVTETGDIYSQVQKPHKYCTTNDIKNEKLEREETPNGDLYTVVNKSKTPNINNETDENRPSRYKTADGLVYAEVSVQEGASRPQSRVKSHPPPVSPKPKTDSGNVVYAEVNTGI